MKVGFILECLRDGPDHKVLGPLVAKLLPRGTELTFSTLGNKQNVVRNCGPVAAQLLRDDCNKVLVLWDLWPAWKTTSACRVQDCIIALDSLKGAGVDRKRVHIICIEQMLESWLLADERALRALLEEWKHPHPLRRFGIPVGAIYDTQPKKLLRKIFREQRCRPYDDMLHAHLISNRWPNLDRVSRVPSFMRFVTRLTT